MKIAPGDTIEIVGDSITENAIWAHDVGCLMDMLVAAMPGRTRIRPAIHGFNGNTSGDILANHMADITGVSPVPTCLITEIGTNDFWFFPVPFATFSANMVQIWAALRAAYPGVQLGSVSILCVGEEYPDTANGAAINAWNAQLAALCTAQSVEYVDVRTPEQVYEQANNTPSPGAHSGLLTSDGVHPILAGRVLMSTAAFSHFVFEGATQTRVNNLRIY